MADGWKLDNLYHTVVNVRDLDESVAFYKLLGFEVLNDRRRVDWPDFVATIFGLKRAKGRGVLMVLPSDPNGPMIDLIEWLAPTAEFPDPARASETVPRIIAFRTSGVRAAHAELSAKGVRFCRDVFVPEEDLGLVGSCCCYDPNGNLIELIELKSGVRHSRANEVLLKDAEA
ncbi:MAG TPA: VOC family protein [Caulobacteraceae bacterium]|jgi:catechol 2,3-dioxygenase-like lactoylglutathione lyase family enzyme